MGVVPQPFQPGNFRLTRNPARFDRPPPLWHNPHSRAITAPNSPQDPFPLNLRLEARGQTAERTMQLPDLSLLLMMAVFWAVFFLLKRTLFGPLGANSRGPGAQRGTFGGSPPRCAGAASRRRFSRLINGSPQSGGNCSCLVKPPAPRANAKRQELLEKARADARLTVTAAQESLDRDVEKAREELRASVESTARAIASLALGRRVA